MDNRGESNTGKPINLKSGRTNKKHHEWAKGFKVGNKTLYHPYTLKDFKFENEN